MSDPFRSEFEGALEKARRAEEALADLRAEYDELKANPPYRERHPVRVFAFVGVMMVAAATFPWLYWRNTYAKALARAEADEEATIAAQLDAMKSDLNEAKRQLTICQLAHGMPRDATIPVLVPTAPTPGKRAIP